ncbi:MAG: TetR/AcrR family transcriptional regulator [Lachnospiraceae bacterium]|nr:TetR/AcrR family transcriptional regulator [Lachnospiraceae bacterium]
MHQEERSKLTRQKILEAAMEEFGKRGYSGGTINNICKTGINKGLVYHHFRSRDELYLECLRISIGRLTDWIHEKKADTSIENYMSARLEFYRTFPNESRIFYESLLEPGAGLESEIRQIQKPLTEMNETLYRNTIRSLKLRPGVTEEKALLYFSQIQQMFNGYFSSPALQRMSLDEKIEKHEKDVPMLLHFMLFGIADEENGAD